MKKIILLFCCFVVSAANATLISTDWQSSGDQLITIDNEAGLEWLDWSYTQNRSFLDVSSQFGVGGEFEGFRYANKNELTTLYSNVGFTFPISDSVSNVSLAQNFTDLFGITFGSEHPSNGGVEALYDYSTTSDQHWVTAVNHHGGLVQPEWFQTNDSSSLSFVGSAIVRTASTVPEPATLTLLGLSLVGIGFSRKKKIS